MKRLRCGEHSLSAELVSRPFASVVMPKQARSQVSENFSFRTGEADTAQSRQLVHGCRKAQERKRWKKKWMERKQKGYSRLVTIHLGSDGFNHTLRPADIKTLQDLPKCSVNKHFISITQLLSLEAISVSRIQGKTYNLKRSYLYLVTEGWQRGE